MRKKSVSRLLMPFVMCWGMWSGGAGICRTLWPHVHSFVSNHNCPTNTNTYYVLSNFQLELPCEHLQVFFVARKLPVNFGSV